MDPNLQILLQAERLQEMEQVHSSQFLKPFVLFLLLIMDLLLFIVENLFQLLEFMDLYNAILCTS